MVIKENNNPARTQQRGKGRKAKSRIDIHEGQKIGVVGTNRLRQEPATL